jgi:hypothetical protein
MLLLYASFIEGKDPTLPMRYQISFTTGGLFIREAAKAAELYFQLGDWDAVRAEIRRGNLLLARTQTALTRTSCELVQRLQGLTRSQLEILADGSRQEQCQVLWLAACKHYPFIREFAAEVVREKFQHLDFTLSYLDFDIFFNDRAEWHEELEQRTQTTRKKLRQVLFRMLHEAQILSPANQILPVMLAPRVAQAVVEEDPALLTIFPISEMEIRKQVRR